MPIAELDKVERDIECYILYVLCPYCNKTHTHGGGDVTKKIVLGSRSSHCGKGEYEIKSNFISK